MNILDSIFSGAKVIIQQLVTVATEAIKLVLEEIDRSPFGHAATQLVQGLNSKLFTQAQNLAEEERNFAEKAQRDGRRSKKDDERLQEISAEREKLRKEMEIGKLKAAGAEFAKEKNNVIATNLSDEELSASVGILSSKTCPSCGGTMRIRQTSFSVNEQRIKFYWQCTMQNQFHCPTIKLNPNDLDATVIRRPDADLDGSSKERKKIWERDDVLVKTHYRVRQSLDEADEEIICPSHLLHMKLLEKPRGNKTLCGNYHFVCLAVNPDGLACSHTVALETLPQVSAMLRRRDGRGIIDG